MLEVAQETPVADTPTDKKPRRRFKTGVLQVAQETPVAYTPTDKKPRRRFNTGVLQVADETPQAPNQASQEAAEEAHRRDTSSACSQAS